MKKAVWLSTLFVLIITLFPFTGFAADNVNMQTGYIKSVSQDELYLTIIDQYGVETNHRIAYESEINGEIYYGFEEALSAIQPGTYASFYEEYDEISIINFGSEFPESRQVNATLKSIEYDNTTQAITAAMTFNYIKTDCIVTMAIYDEYGVLLNVASKTATTADTDFSVEMPALPDWVELPVKIFFWDNAENLKPINVTLEGSVGFSKGGLQYGYILDLELEELTFSYAINMQIQTADGLFTKTASSPLICKPDGSYVRLDTLAWTADDAETSFAELEALIKGKVVKFSYNPYDYITRIVCEDFNDDFCNSTPADYTPTGFKYVAASRYFKNYGYLTEDALIFLLSYDTSEGTEICNAVSSSDLVDGDWYTIYSSYCDADDFDDNVIVLTPCEKSVFSVVTSIAETTNDKGDTIWNISYYANGNEAQQLTMPEAAQGNMPSVGDIVCITSNGNEIADIKYLWDLTENIRTATYHMDTVTTGDYIAADGEVLDGGIAVAYKNSSKQISFADNNDEDTEVQTYKLNQAENTYVISFTKAREIVIGTIGSYKYFRTIYEGVADTDTFTLKNNSSSVITGTATAEEAKLLTDYVLLREYDGRVTDYVVIRGFDTAIKN